MKKYAPTKTRKAPASMPKLNVPLIRKIQRHILEEPRRFQMSNEVVRVTDQREWALRRSSDSSESMPPCGTSACIAGWTNLLTGIPKHSSGDRIRRASRQLGITFHSLGWLDHPLFLANQWPSPFDEEYVNATTQKQRATIACQRLDYLITTGE